MANIWIPRQYPSPLRYEHKVRNGRVPDWTIPLQAGARVNFANAHCRKLVFSKTMTRANLSQGSNSTQTPWRWQFRTGESPESGNSINVKAEAIVYPADNSAGADPRWRVFIGGTNSDYRRAPYLVTSPNFDDLTSQRVNVTGLAPNTQYQCGLEIEDHCRIAALSVWEYVSLDVDTAATYAVDTGLYAFDSQITDTQHESIAVTDPHTLWKHNGAQYLSLACDDESNPWASTATSLENMLQPSHSTTVGANTAGFNLQPLYHNPAHTDNVNCTIAVYGSSTPAGADGQFVLKDDGGNLAVINNFDSTPGWETTTFNLDGTSNLQKVDPQFQAVTGTETLKIWAVSIYAYES